MIHQSPVATLTARRQWYTRGCSREAVTPMDRLDGLTGRVVVITAASSGIGAATALAITRRGAGVALVARRADRLEGVAERIRGRGGTVSVVPADVTVEGSVRAALQASLATHGRVDAFVNSAGIGHEGSLVSGDTHLWRQLIDVNLLGTAIACREALDVFDRTSGGHIVNISSTSGHRIPPGGGFYAVTKFAVTAFTEALRQELAAAGSPTRVTCVAPGRVVSEIFGSDPDRAPTAEEMDPREVGEVIADVLASPSRIAVNSLVMRAVGQVR